MEGGRRALVCQLKIKIKSREGSPLKVKGIFKRKEERRRRIDGDLISGLKRRAFNAKGAPLTKVHRGPTRDPTLCGFKEACEERDELKGRARC